MVSRMEKGGGRYERSREPVLVEIRDKGAARAMDSEAGRRRRRRETCESCTR
jgi:hypothetical protein